MDLVWQTVREILEDTIEDGEKLIAVMHMVNEFEKKYKNIYKDHEQLKEEIKDIIEDVKILVDTIYNDLK